MPAFLAIPGKDNMRSRILFVASRGFLGFTGYYHRVRKEINLVHRDGRYLPDLAILSSPGTLDPGIRNKLKKEVAAEIRTISILSLLRAQTFVNYKFIHSENLVVTFLVLVARYLRIHRLPVIFDYHGASPEENWVMHGQKLLFYVYKLMERFSLSQCDQILVVSEAFRDYLNEKFKIHKGKIAVIRNFLETEWLDQTGPGKTELRRRLDLPLERLIFVYAGNFQQWQEKEILVLLANYLGKYENSVLFLILTNSKQEALRLDSSVCQIRSAEHHEVFQFLHASDFGILLRRNNILNVVADPTKLAEYLACGLNVLVSGIGDAKKYIAESNCGIFLNDPIQDRNSLYESLAKILKKTPLKVPLNENSVEIAKKYYHESVAKDQLFRVYQIFNEIA